MSAKCGEDELIECQNCFRTFHTQGQFGQHSRICRGESKVASIADYKYKYSFIEKHCKNELQIKTRFVIRVDGECLINSWKDIARKHKLDDNGVKQLLSLHNLDSVYFTVRNRKESGLIIANFIVRSVHSAKRNIHSAKLLICSAVSIVFRALPSHITMVMHLCKMSECKELVIRDTEGYCSRHRAQKYHKKERKKYNKKRKIIFDDKNKTKRSKVTIDLSYNVLYTFLSLNCYIFQTPFNLLNVSINQSLLRQNGINLISVNYSKYIPNPKQILNKNDYLIVFGVKKDIESYLNYHKANHQMINNKNSIRFEEFIDELIKYYMLNIAVPTHLIGTTLSDIRLYEYGINVISINLNVNHAQKMSETTFKPNDMLLCCFDRANDKDKQLFNAFNVRDN